MHTFVFRPWSFVRTKEVPMPATSLDQVVSLAKRRGFIYPSSEIYGGLQGVFDYGPLGVELKNNIKQDWWRANVYERDDMEGLDAAILMNRLVWKYSGHEETFVDPMVDCRNCKSRWRADQIHGKCPNCGSTDLTEPRPFNMMFKTAVGPVADAELVRLPAARDGAGHLRQLRECAVDHQPQAAVRDRPDRQGLPQRDQPAQLPVPRARVRYAGDRVLRDAGHRGRVASALAG